MCKHGWPKAQDGALPWLHDGQWTDACPTRTLPRWVFHVAAEFSDYEKGIHPVALGRASWLPGIYQEALRTMRDAVGDEKQRQAERQAAAARK